MTTPWIWPWMGTLAAAWLAWSPAADAAPLNGCTFLKDRLEEDSWDCANFEVQSESCTKYKYVGATVVQYQGDLVKGRLPAYFIEVTPFIGESIFANAGDGAVLQANLDLAQDFFESGTKAKGLLELLPDELKEMAEQGHREHWTPDGSRGAFYHARLIKVPYAATAWAFASIGVSAPAGLPLCFEGLSEYAPWSWADLDSSPEALHAAALHAVIGNTCVTKAYAAGVVTTGPAPPGGSSSFTPMCAIPMAREVQRAQIFLPTSEATRPFTNPRWLCNGRLGSPLPRTGYVDFSEPETDYEAIAWRMASVSNDLWYTGGVKAGDRWQRVWPPQAGSTACFQPGTSDVSRVFQSGFTPEAALSLILENDPANPSSDGIRQPDDEGLYNMGMSPAVYAIWRPFEECVEPFQGPLFENLDLPFHENAMPGICRFSESVIGGGDMP